MTSVSKCAQTHLHQASTHGVSFVCNQPRGRQPTIRRAGRFRHQQQQRRWWRHWYIWRGRGDGIVVSDSKCWQHNASCCHAACVWRVPSWTKSFYCSCPMWPLPLLSELRWRTDSNESTLSFVSLWHYSCHTAVHLTFRCRAMIMILLLHVYITLQFYCQIPVLANSTPVAGTDQFQYLQIPSLLPVITNSSTCKFHPCCLYWQIHYLQFPCWERNLFYFQIPVLANSCHAYLLSESSTCNFHYLQIHTTPTPTDS